MGKPRDKVGDAAIAKLASLQHGVVSIGQADDIVGESVRKSRLWTGAWRSRTERVIVMPGAPRTWYQDLLTGVLHFGHDTVVAGASGASFWGLDGFRQEKITLLTSVEQPHDLDGYTVQRAKDLADWQRTVYRGVPVLKPGPLLFYLLHDVHPERAPRVLDEAFARNLITPARMHKVFDAMAKRGKKGTTTMRLLLQDRPFDYIPPASGVESRFLEITKGHFPDPRRQVDVGDDDEWIGRVDFVYDPVKVIAEINSVRYHRYLTQERADAERYERLERAGFLVVPCWDDDIFRHPSVVRANLREAFNRRRVA